MKPTIVLASGSPRRRELLTQIGLEFEVSKAVSEEQIQDTTASEAVQKLAQQKAKEVCHRYLQQHPDDKYVFLGADTIVVANGQILGKPKDEADAFMMISSLAGQYHEVMTGVCLIYTEGEHVIHEDCFYQATKVKISPMSKEEILAYIKTKEPMDKAGAYGIQGLFARYVERIDGDYNNVVGLPVGLVYHRLKERGLC